MIIVLLIVILAEKATNNGNRVHRISHLITQIKQKPSGGLGPVGLLCKRFYNDNVMAFKSGLNIPAICLIWRPSNPLLDDPYIRVFWKLLVLILFPQFQIFTYIVIVVFILRERQNASICARLSNIPNTSRLVLKYWLSKAIISRSFYMLYPFFLSSLNYWEMFNSALMSLTL